MIFRFTLLLVFCDVHAVSQSIQNAFIIQDTPAYAIQNPAFKYETRNVRYLQFLYENRFNKKDLSITSIGIGSSQQVFSWNALVLCTGNAIYSKSLIYLNASIQVNSKVRVGVGINGGVVRSRNKEISEFDVYPILGFAVKARDENIFFTSFKFKNQNGEFFHVASYEHYFRSDFSYRLQSSWTFREDPEAILVLKYKHVKEQVFYLGLSSSNSPFLVGYDFKCKKVHFVLSFWYHMRLGSSNQVSTSVSL